jgi:hypothetical protein
LVDELSAQLTVLSDGLARTVTANPRSVERGRAAVTRLTALRDRLITLLGQRAAENVAGDPRPSRGARPTSARASIVGDDAGRALTEAERQFYARDAYQVARVIAVAIITVMLFNIVTGRSAPFFLQLLYGSQAALCVICLAVLQRTRARPSEKLGIILYLVVVIPMLFGQLYSQIYRAQGTAAFEPLITTKVTMVVLALAAPRRRWLSRTLVLLVAVQGIVLFYALRFDAMRDRIPMVEPWPLLNYLLIAIALLLLRDQRRLASLLLLRADRETAALVRQAGVVLAVLDQLGSPLQTLTSSTEILFQQQPDHPGRETLESALRAISSLRRRIPQIDPRAYEYLGVSLDAASLLRPQ